MECLICNKSVPDYEPKFCCNGYQCGCMGQPIEPCVCSEECYQKLFTTVRNTKTVSLTKLEVDIL